MERFKKSFLHRTGQYFLVLFLVWIGATFFFVVKNQFGINYKNLSTTDQVILREVEEYYKSNKNRYIWEGYNLNKYTFLAVNGRGGEAYLINPQKSVKSIFAREIKMPSDFAVKVYRVAAMSPSLYKTYGLGKFSTLNEKITVCDNDVFYLRYKKADNINDGDYNSYHFITFLSHEAFHTQVQKSWGSEESGGRFSTESLSGNDKKILGTRYDILQNIQEEVWKESPNINILKENIKEYIAESEKLKSSNPSYFKDETVAETFEGTANYVSAKASKAANYNYNVTCYSDPNGPSMEHIPFNEIMPFIENGQMGISSISTNWIYSSGGLLCEVLDSLGNTTWQNQLNHQSNKIPITLYDILKETVT